MSNCMNGGRFTHKWSDQVWHAPSGREVFVGEDEPHEAAVLLADGTTRYHHWAGPPAVGVEVDGEAFVSEDETWHVDDGVIVAIERGGVVYRRVDGSE